MAASKDTSSGSSSWLKNFMLRNVDYLFKFFRIFFPILRVSYKGKRYVALTRFDDVREVLNLPNVFQVPYGDKLNVIMGGEKFFLGIDDEPDYTRQTTLMRVAMPRDEANGGMADYVARLAQERIDRSKGRIDVAMELSQTVTTQFLCRYFGIAHPDEESFSDSARLLFDFQFVDIANDPDLKVRAEPVAREMRGYIDGVISRRKSERGREDDVLERCLKLQDGGFAGTSDVEIRTNMMGFIVGGLPQPPMVIPQLIDVLVSKPSALEQAQEAARGGDNALLSAILFEALRYHPLTPGLFRTCQQDYCIARSTGRSRDVTKGTTVFAATRSAMFDGRRLSKPGRFIVDRPEHSYMHFGHGMHECFGRYINRQLIPGICKPLLACKNLRRARGKDGRLQKDGAFSKSLVLEFDA